MSKTVAQDLDMSIVDRLKDNTSQVGRALTARLSFLEYFKTFLSTSDRYNAHPTVTSTAAATSTTATTAYFDHLNAKPIEPVVTSKL